MPNRCVDGGNHTETPTKNTMIEILAQTTGITGSLHIALGATAAAIGVGMIGTKAVEAVGRNPGASGKVLVQSILGMALAEAIAFYVIFLA
jgi:F-type H+-transporting ATPase subunit c